MNYKIFINHNEKITTVMSSLRGLARSNPVINKALSYSLDCFTPFAMTKKTGLT